MNKGRYVKPRTEEERYLADLLADFGVEGHPGAQDALRLIYERYRELERRIPALASLVPDLAAEGETVPDAFLLLLTDLHLYMYEGVLRNAGAFRHPADPLGGTVRFGGTKSQSHRARYHGTSAAGIEQEIRTALRLLGAAEDPVRAAIYFYLELSAIHPFYDANGRIGRVLVSVYLFRHGYYVNWDRLDRKHGLFIKKLNACLDRRGSKEKGKYDVFRSYLFDFWRAFVEPLTSFYDG